jgi:hypothetical protein
MSKLYFFAAVFLFWSALAASLMQTQLVASPVHKMRVPTYHSTPNNATGISQVSTSASTAAYN